MSERNTDADWEALASIEPYWSVYTDDRFRGKTLAPPARDEFFGSGETHIARVFEVITTQLDPHFAPRRALDFGSGVGRLLIPLARRCGEVVGVDVSDTMIQEARANAARFGVTNYRLVKGDDDLTAVDGTFDLVNTFIVLQHVPCHRGQRLFARLVELVADGGVGVIHLTYSTADIRPEIHQAWADYGRMTPRLAAAPPPDPDWPTMQMNPYTLNPLFDVLQTAGVRRVYFEFTDHGGYRGVVLFFRKVPGLGYRF